MDSRRRAWIRLAIPSGARATCVVRWSTSGRRRVLSPPSAPRPASPAPRAPANGKPVRGPAPPALSHPPRPAFLIAWRARRSFGSSAPPHANYNAVFRRCLILFDLSLCDKQASLYFVDNLKL
ncbi:unnamed protein product [Pieris macdunnoughi]|uniref:Uncharacterized protein n=1 Tax=Pieris macdunnoughi TaxID=345717 RepID=A0A821T9M5_9NEOP|nr:unnamed protein product [Pieris macdunnoughi]